MIKNSKVFFKTKAAFDKALEENELDERSIVFIKDIRSIWTHGVMFNGNSSNVILSQSDYNNLESYGDVLYFIVEDGSGEPDTPDEPVIPDTPQDDEDIILPINGQVDENVLIVTSAVNNETLIIS